VLAFEMILVMLAAAVLLLGVARRWRLPYPVLIALTGVVVVIAPIDVSLRGVGRSASSVIGAFFKAESVEAFPIPKIALYSMYCRIHADCVITTPRLILRPWQDSDLPLFA
jgi:hypothetical protein